MGTWGVALFSDDTAADVRDGYRQLLADGQDGPAATDAMIARWRDAIDDPDDGPVFWLALAVTQHALGRLEDRVRDRAMEVLDRGLGLDRWRDDPKQLRKRENILTQVRAQLASPQPALKRIAPRFRDSCAWERGELIGYLAVSGNWLVLRVLGHETHDNGTSPVCELLDWQGRELTTIDTLSGRAVREGQIPQAVLFRGLASTYAEWQTTPSLAMQQVLADAGLIAPPAPTALGFDPSQVGVITETIHRMESGDKTIMSRLAALAKKRKPALLEPVRQFSIRRELKKSELPARRVRRLGSSLVPSQSLGEWLVFRWHELDEAMKDVFGME